MPTAVEFLYPRILRRGISDRICIGAPELFGEKPADGDHHLSACPAVEVLVKIWGRIVVEKRLTEPHYESVGLPIGSEWQQRHAKAANPVKKCSRTRQRLFEGKTSCSFGKDRDRRR